MNKLAKLKRLKTKSFRDAYVQANISHGLAHQIRALRQQRGWSQQDLARKIGASSNSLIARLEDPSYGKHTLTTLQNLASALDVALLVKFTSFGRLLAEVEDVSPRTLGAESFEVEYPKLLETMDIQTSATVSHIHTWGSGNSYPTPVHADIDTKFINISNTSE